MAALQDSKTPPHFCRRKSKWLLQNNALISQVSKKSRWAMPFSSHLVWCVRPSTLPNHLVNVEKGKPEWFMLRSNGGGDQDFRFISRTSALHCHWTPVPAGTDHATGTKPPALYNYFYSVFPDFQSFCCAISDYSILQGFTEEAK